MHLPLALTARARSVVATEYSIGCPTLQSLYNAKPAWLRQLHRDLNAVVTDAYAGLPILRKATRCSACSSSTSRDRLPSGRSRLRIRPPAFWVVSASHAFKLAREVVVQHHAAPRSAKLPPFAISRATAPMLW
jgi:hypothetical protein